MKVLITDKINETAGKIIEQAAEPVFLPTMTEDELCAAIGEYDAIMIRSQTKMTKKVIEAGKNLKIIGRAGVGVDNVDIEAATNRGIIVVNSPDGNTTAAAEHTIAMMLAMSRNIALAAETTKQGLWERSKYTGCEVFGKTLGIIGFGKIGQHVAKVASALGMKIVVADPYTTKESVEKIGAEYVESLDAFWPKCDFITIHTPKTRETAYLINKNTLNRMKKGVRIINCARGGIIDEAALKEALETGQVKCAAIDVFENEPNIAESPLVKYEGNILLTPHLGASTSEAQFNVAVDVAEQIKEVLTGGSAHAAVNIPALKPEKLEPVKDYMKLAEYLGEFGMQITSGNLKSLEITVNGALSEHDVSPLEIALLKGAFSVSGEGVNYVNAPIIAKNKGINVLTAKSQAPCSYLGSMTLKVVTDKDENVVQAALVSDDTPRFVKINKYNTSIKPEKHILLVPHENKPSMIAKVATVLGENNHNISRMEVVQKSGETDSESIMIINTEDAVSCDVLDKIAKIDGVRSPKCVNINI